MGYETGTVITATELKANLGKYLDYVCEDNEVVVTKNGRKALRLTPYITDIERYFTVKEKALDYEYGGKKVSYEEFMEINEKSELRLEYINGEIIVMSTPNTFHQSIAGNLFTIFRNCLRGKTCKAFFAPFEAHFYKREFKYPDVCQPDLLIACDLEGNVNDKGCYMGTPSLVVEILSPSTRTRDMIDKLNTYMLSGVKEFWVIDPRVQTILVYGFKDFIIDDFLTYRKGDAVRSYWFDGLEAPVEEVFE